jgi:hypothetical protein
MNPLRRTMIWLLIVLAASLTTTLLVTAGVAAQFVSRGLATGERDHEAIYLAPQGLGSKPDINLLMSSTNPSLWCTTGDYPETLSPELIRLLELNAWGQGTGFSNRDDLQATDISVRHWYQDERVSNLVIYDCLDQVLASPNERLPEIDDEFQAVEPSVELPDTHPCSARDNAMPAS